MSLPDSFYFTFYNHNISSAVPSVTLEILCFLNAFTTTVGGIPSPASAIHLAISLNMASLWLVCFSQPMAGCKCGLS